MKIKKNYSQVIIIIKSHYSNKDKILAKDQLTNKLGIGFL